MVSSFNVFEIFEKISKEKIEKVNFPSHFEIVLKLKAVLSDSQSSTQKVVGILYGEPLIASKVLMASNVASLRGNGNIVELDSAVTRLGIEQVRRVAISTAVNQLRESKPVLQYASISRRVWLRSLYVAAGSYVVAKENPEFSQSEARFAGLMLKIGAFYLLHRLGSIPDFIAHPDDVKEGLTRNYLPATRKVLEFLGLPKDIQDSAFIEPFANSIPEHPPTTLAEVVNAGNVFANRKVPWYEEDVSGADLPEKYLRIEDAVHDEFLCMQAEYRT